MTDKETATAQLPSRKVITASSCRVQAMLFNIGNFVSMLPGAIVAPIAYWGELEKMTLIIFMLFMIVPPILWFGISIIIYALTKHHPDEKVGHYVQNAAYRFYGLFGSIIPIGTFYGTDWRLWILTGGVIAMIILPWSVWDFIRIYRDDWQDIDLQQQRDLASRGQ